MLKENRSKYQHLIFFFAYRQDSLWVSQHNLSIIGKHKDFGCEDLITIAEQNSIRNTEKFLEQAL